MDLLAGEDERPVVTDEPLVTADDEQQDDRPGQQQPERPSAPRRRRLPRRRRAAAGPQRPRITMFHHNANNCRALWAMAGRRKNCDLPDGRK